MPKKVRPGSKRLPPWQTPQTQCRGSYSRKMSKKGVFEQAKDTFSLLSICGTKEGSERLSYDERRYNLPRSGFSSTIFDARLHRSSMLKRNHEMLA